VERGRLLCCAFPKTPTNPPAVRAVPARRPVEAGGLVTTQLGSNPHWFAAKFSRRAASRALLLPRRRSGMDELRLWAKTAQARVRAAERGGAGFSSFPILLEQYRECLRDVFDMPGT